jgi:transcriptional regulator
MFSEGQNDLNEGLQDLVTAMEAGRDRDWKLTELEGRYGKLAAQIVAFRADIVERRVAFRLAQDEDAQTFAEVVAGVESGGSSSLAQLMREFRAGSAQQ